MTIQKSTEQIDEQSQRQKDEHERELERDKEYIAAQRAAVESVDISRSALETTVRQGEQLDRCNYLVDRQKYYVEKSSRLVRGMTWSGWIANVFSPNVEPPPGHSSSRQRQSQSQSQSQQPNQSAGSGPPSPSKEQLRTVLQNYDLDNAPEQLQEIAIMVKNYECNVLLLLDCETLDQYQTCIVACDQLYNSAIQAMDHDNDTAGDHSISSRTYNDGNSLQFLTRLKSKLCQVKDLQMNTMESIGMSFRTRDMNHDEGRNQGSEQDVQRLSMSRTRTTTSTTFNNHREREKRPSKETTLTSNPELLSRMRQQDEHLDILNSSVQELLHNGAAISSSLEEQNQILDALDDGVMDVTEETNMVGRRADRIASRPLLPWRSPKSNFRCCVAIQHVQTGKFLTIDVRNGNKITLQQDLHPDLSIFQVYERPNSKLIGLMNRCAGGRWLGQSTLGYVVCNAKTFGGKEEWELDDGNMARTKILCACANWGSGGWLEADERTEHFSIGGYDAKAKQIASLWSVVVIE